MILTSELLVNLVNSILLPGLPSFNKKYIFLKIQEKLHKFLQDM